MAPQVPGYKQAVSAKLAVLKRRPIEMSTVLALTQRRSGRYKQVSGVREDGANPSLPRNCKHRELGIFRSLGRKLWEGR